MRSKTTPPTRPLVGPARALCWRTAVATGLLAACVAGAAAADAAAPAETAASAAPSDAWPVIGRQGVLRFVVVPVAQARDPAAYERQLAHLCEAGQSCFLNFYTNSTGAPLTVPLPDAIEAEATAVFRKSIKRASEGLRFSCRMQLDASNCF